MESPRLETVMDNKGPQESLQDNRITSSFSGLRVTLNAAKSSSQKRNSPEEDSPAIDVVEERRISFPGAADTDSLSAYLKRPRRNGSGSIFNIANTTTIPVTDNPISSKFHQPS